VLYLKKKVIFIPKTTRQINTAQVI